MGSVSARLSLLILAVPDPARSAGFYRQAFGWTTRVQVAPYVELDAGGFRLGLYEREAFGANPGRIPGVVPPGALRPAELYVTVEDVEAATARLVEAGAELLDAARPRDWGDDVAYLADLDGHVVAVARASSTR